MKHIIALDIGGTKIEGVLFGNNFRILQTHRVLTEAKKGRKKVLQNICRVIDELNPKSADAIGISAPGNPHNLWIGEPNIPCLIHFDLKRFLEKKYHKKVAVENDSKCFAIAEHFLGAGKNSRNMVGVIIGTGVGGGIIINNALYSGSVGGAGEVGQMIIDPKGMRCKCGQLGDLESWCAGPYIVKRYILSGGKLKNPSPYLIWRSKEKTAKKIVDEVHEKLAVGIANLVNILSPELFVLGGGISKDINYKNLQQRAEKYALPSLRNSFRIKKFKIGDSAGVLGAALCAMEKVKN